MADNARRTGPALEAHQQFLLWLVPMSRVMENCPLGVMRNCPLLES